MSLEQEKEQGKRITLHYYNHESQPRDLKRESRFLATMNHRQETGNNSKLQVIMNHKQETIGINQNNQLQVIMNHRQVKEIKITSDLGSWRRLGMRT